MAYYVAHKGERIEVWEDEEVGRVHRRALHWVTTHINLSLVSVTTIGVGLVHTVTPAGRIRPRPPDWAHLQITDYQVGQVTDFLAEGIWREGLVYNTATFAFDIVARNNHAILLHHATMGPHLQIQEYRLALEWTNQGWISRTTGLPAFPPPPPPRPLPIFPPLVIEPVPSVQQVLTEHPIPAAIPFVDLDIPSGSSGTPSSASSGSGGSA